MYLLQSHLLCGRVCRGRLCLWANLLVTFLNNNYSVGLHTTTQNQMTDSKYLPSYSSDLTVNVDCVRNNSSSELLSQQLSAIVPGNNELIFKNNCVCRAICKLTSTLTNKQSITRFWLHLSHVHVMLYS